MNLRGLVRAMTMAVAAACIAWAAAAAAQPSGAALRTTYEKLAPSLANSPFGRPIALTSGETANGLKGDVYGVVDHPLAQLSATLGKLANWCDMPGRRSVCACASSTGVNFVQGRTSKFRSDRKSRCPTRGRRSMRRSATEPR